MGKPILRKNETYYFTGWDTAYINGKWVIANYIDYQGEEFIIYNGEVYQENGSGVIVKIARTPASVGFGSNTATTATTTNDNSSKSSFDFKSLFEGIGSLFSGVGNFTSSLTGKGAATNNNYYSGGSGSGSGEDSKTGTYLLYGGLLLFVVLIMFLLLKK